MTFETRQAHFQCKDQVNEHQINNGKMIRWLRKDAFSSAERRCDRVVVVVFVFVFVVAMTRFIYSSVREVTTIGRYDLRDG